MLYLAVASVMKKEFDSDARQLQIQSELEGLRIRGLMQKDGITEYSLALTAVVD